jgi:hypothetical protein
MVAEGILVAWLSNWRVTMATINGNLYVERTPHAQVLHNQDKIKCPKCSNGVYHPDGSGNLLIQVMSAPNQRGGWAQCLVCAGFYTAELLPTRGNYWVDQPGRAGWFQYN